MKARLLLGKYKEVFVAPNFMRKQKGQSAVEFALMAPIIFAMVFVMIYGGVMFMEYFTMSNNARTVARQVAVTTDEDERNQLMTNFNRDSERDFPLYNVTRKVSYDDDTNPVDVVVEINFTREKSYLILPKEFTMVYRMKLENKNENSTDE